MDLISIKTDKQMSFDNVRLKLYVKSYICGRE